MARFDVTRLRLRHYRSIAGCDVTLGPLAILVGPNGSGKSNFIDSLRFTSQALSETLDNALRDRSGIEEVRRRSHGHPDHFGIQIHFRVGEQTGWYGFQVGSGPDGNVRVTREECRIAGENAAHHYLVHDGRVVESSEGPLPAVPLDRLFLVTASGIDAFRPVYDGLTGINVYNINPDSIRQLEKPESGHLLRRDGRNIASVLERCKRDNPDAKDRIVEYLSRVVNGITDVDREALGAWETIRFQQRVAGDEVPWTFQATSMSDGTLRALGVLTALFAGGPTALSPVGIEEPETALHPAAAGLLLDALRDASDTRQVLVTTHSPDLLDSSSIGPDEILAVRSAEGNSEIAPVDEAARNALKNSLYTPGELLRADQLMPAPAPTLPDLFA